MKNSESIGAEMLQKSHVDILEKIVALQDKSYQAFQSKLMPTVPSETIIGVRTPMLRKLAKEISGTKQAESFLNSLPHKYYEENNLHAFLVENIKDYDTALVETEKFLPYIDNWATCDCFCPKVFAKHKEELLIPIRRWLNSDKIYTVRYAMGMLMRYYLDEEFRTEGGRCTQRRILSEYDESVVLCDGPSQAAGSCVALADNQTAGYLDSQQDHSKGSGELPNYAGNEAAALYAAHPFLK